MCGRVVVVWRRLQKQKWMVGILLLMLFFQPSRKPMTYEAYCTRWLVHGRVVLWWLQKQKFVDSYEIVVVAKTTRMV